LNRQKAEVKTKKLKNMQTYRDLIVWQKAMSMVLLVYGETKGFPKEETFGLTSQIQRSVVSIPSNIAEGYGRNSTGDYIRFLQIASGSLYEFQTQLEISSQLGYLSEEKYVEINSLSIEIEKMLSSLLSKVKNSQK
jgi:four helix bundle protein